MKGRILREAGKGEKGEKGEKGTDEKVCAGNFLFGGFFWGL